VQGNERKYYKNKLFDSLPGNILKKRCNNIYITNFNDFNPCNRM